MTNFKDNWTSGEEWAITGPTGSNAFFTTFNEHTAAIADLEAGGGGGGNVAGDTHAATGKTTPVDADEVPLVDSAASNALKKLTFANLKAWVKSWITKTDVGLGSVDNTADTAKPVSAAQQTALDAKAPLASPAFTGTPTGITKTHVGLGNVDNTADVNKPVSTAQQTALDAKAPTASPTFTGTVSGVTKAHVGLGNVDNTADTAKPVSTAQQTALDGKQPLDADLTSIAALSTATYGRGLLTQASATAARTALQAAPFHSPVPAYWPLRPYETTADIPTYSTTNSGVGGATTTYNAMSTKLAWSSARITKFGYVQGAFTFAGVSTFPNVSAGRVSSSDYTHKWTPSAFYFGVLFEGTVLRFQDVVAESNARPLRLWVDGKYAGQFDMGAVSGGTSRYHTFTFPDARLRRIVIGVGWNWFPASLGSPDTNSTIQPLAQLPYRVHMLGDSWTQGFGTPDADGNIDAMYTLMASMTGWEVFGGAQQATAPGTPATDGTSGVSSQTWNSPQRMRAITDCNPHLVILHGTLNADGFASTTLPGFLDDLYARVAVAAPNARIIHVGPQAVDPSSAGATRLANRDTCAARAAAAGISFIDPIGDSWITGTGTYGSVVAGGNSSLYYGGTTGVDTGHLQSYEYYTARMVAAVRNVLSA